MKLLESKHVLRTMFNALVMISSQLFFCLDVKVITFYSNEHL